MPTITTPNVYLSPYSLSEILLQIYHQPPLRSHSSEHYSIPTWPSSECLMLQSSGDLAQVGLSVRCLGLLFPWSQILRGQQKHSVLLSSLPSKEGNWKTLVGIMVVMAFTEESTVWGKKTVRKMELPPLKRRAAPEPAREKTYMAQWPSCASRALLPTLQITQCSLVNPMQWGLAAPWSRGREEETQRNACCQEVFPVTYPANQSSVWAKPTQVITSHQ